MIDKSTPAGLRRPATFAVWKRELTTATAAAGRLWNAKPFEDLLGCDFGRASYVDIDASSLRGEDPVGGAPIQRLEMFP